MKIVPVESIDEFDLWSLFKTGDRDAFAQIYERYVGVLYNYGFHITANSNLVEDAIQDLFVALWQSREKLSDTTSIKYYLFRSVRRQILKLSEKDSRHEKYNEGFIGQISANPSIEMLLIDEEQRQEQWNELQSALQALTPRQLEAIRLHFYEGFDLAGVASIMEMNEQSVRNILQRSLIKLRHVMPLFPLFFRFF